MNIPACFVNAQALAEIRPQTRYWSRCLEVPEFAALRIESMERSEKKRTTGSTYPSASNSPKYFFIMKREAIKLNSIPMFFVLNARTNKSKSARNPKIGINDAANSCIWVVPRNA